MADELPSGMVQYQVRAPDGSVHVIAGPSNASPAEIEAAAAKVIPPSPFNPASAPTSDIIGQLGHAADKVNEFGKNVAGFAKETGANLLGGMARGYNSLDALSKKIPGIAAVRAGTAVLTNAAGFPPEPSNAMVDQAIEEKNPTLPQDVPYSSRLWQSGMRGVGGALTVPVPGAGVFGNAFPGLMGGMAGQMGGDYSKNLPEPLKTGIPVLTSGAAAMLSGFGAGPKQSVAQQDIREALHATPPSVFDQARANLEAARRSGATTQTAAEAFPSNSAIIALGDKARNAALDNPLRTKTQDRGEDIAGLTDTALGRMAPSVDPNEVANQTTEAANGVIQTAKNLRRDAISARLGAEAPLLPQNVGDIEKWLVQQANATGATPSHKAAYLEAASKFRDAQGNLITNPQTISLRLVEMQDAPKNANWTGYNGQSVQHHDNTAALADARDAVSSFRPGFGQALDEFGQFSRSVLSPLKTGPIGSLSDRNPLTAGQTPVSRLGGLLAGNSDQTIQGTARQLADPVMTGGPTSDPGQIARAIAEVKLAKRPTNPGEVLRGSPGSPAETNFTTLLDTAGINANQAMEPLRVADRLQPYANAPGNRELPRMQLGQLLLRPFRTMDMGLTAMSERKVNAEVANLLARDDPHVINELQRIAMFDPGVRKALTIRGMFIPAVTQQEPK